MTRQRATLVKLVARVPSPFTVDRLVDHLRGAAELPNVSVATVYRTRGELVDAGVLSVMHGGS
ncbi:MAG: transcriptional repressor [Planctomycetota bacterium]